MQEFLDYVNVYILNKISIIRLVLTETFNIVYDVSSWNLQMNECIYSD